MRDNMSDLLGEGASTRAPRFRGARARGANKPPSVDSCSGRAVARDRAQQANLFVVARGAAGADSHNVYYGT